MSNIQIGDTYESIINFFCTEVSKNSQTGKWEIKTKQLTFLCAEGNQTIDIMAGDSLEVIGIGESLLDGSEVVMFLHKNGGIIIPTNQICSFATRTRLPVTSSLGGLTTNKIRIPAPIGTPTPIMAPAPIQYKETCKFCGGPLYIGLFTTECINKCSQSRN